MNSCGMNPSTLSAYPRCFGGPYILLYPSMFVLATNSMVIFSKLLSYLIIRFYFLNFGANEVFHRDKEQNISNIGAYPKGRMNFGELDHTKLKP